MHPLVNIAIAASRNAANLIIRYSDKISDLNITTKGKNDYCTEIDIKAERAIITSIHKAYPEHGIIAEESGIINPGADVVWIIDPLDGTKNYIHGFPFYAISIAIQVKGRVEHAVICDPIRQEIFTATRGSGARLNDKRLRVAQKTQLSEALISAGLSRYQGPELNLAKNLSIECAGFRRTGSASLDLAYVAAGRLDGYWGYGLNIWDFAAGVLLVQEAGGLCSDFQGGETFWEKGDIVTGNPKILKAMLQNLVF
jgi:myo-inositol-1(or 4)-monophosphatase